jgi:7-cyano-7-deazaguanine synthase in queuosine biosynthesis
MKHIIGFSGGIDSQSAALWCLNRFESDDVILLNSTAGGNEHSITTDFIRHYSETIHPVVMVNAINADMWATPGFAETRGLDSAAELTFPEMARIKGRFPSRCAQFCTGKLKVVPKPTPGAS